MKYIAIGWITVLAVIFLSLTTIIHTTRINNLNDEIERLDKINVLLLERTDVYHKIDSVQHIIVMQHLEKLQEESGK